MKEIQGKPQNGLQLVSTNGSHQVNGQTKKCVCNNKGKNINLFIVSMLYKNRIIV